MNIRKMEVSFWRHKSKQPGKAQLYCRVSVGNQRKDIGSTGLTIAFGHWDGAYVTADDPEADFKNEHLDSLRNQLRAVFNDLFRKRETITAGKIKRLYLGRTGSISLLAAFELCIDDCRTDPEREMSDDSLRVYTNVQKKIRHYLNLRHATDLLVEDFDVLWMKAYRKWMKELPLEPANKSQPQIGHASSYVAKHAQIIKTVMIWAKLNKLTERNPLDGYRTPRTVYPDPLFLTEDEFQRLRAYRFRNPALQRVADLFILLCRTGFHYGDLQDFVRQYKTALRRGIDGEPWLVKQRIKTDVTARVPLFDEVREIVDKYGGWENLPLIGLNSFNKWLKLLAAELGFHPDLSSKAGRKTFTDWCFNTLGLTTDTILVMLGRKSAEGLEVYGRPDERRVAAELRDSKEMQERKRRKAS